MFKKPNTLELDDGGGMDPEAMRRCMSFGFSDKKSKSAIGHCTHSIIFVVAICSIVSSCIPLADF